ncbi:MAG: hypothetical protein ACREXT_06145, partial [Gammaproteobacteria bacterium]
MSAVELLYGSRHFDDVVGARDGAPTLIREKIEDIVLPDVEIHYCLFELPMASALARLPTSLHPSIPAVLGITIWKCASGPLGPFSLAYVGAACRTGIKPRHFIHGAFCDVSGIGRWFAKTYGLDCQPASIHSLETYDRIHSRITVEGAAVLDLATIGAQPLVGRGATVKYSPALNVARLDSQVTLIQMEASFNFKRVVRGIPATHRYDAAALG